MKKIYPLTKTISPVFGATTLMFAFGLAQILIGTAQAQQPITQEEAYAIGVDGYLYF
jgi:hypothetical protein